MKTAFEKLENYNSYVWIAIFIDVVISLLFGFLKKFTGIITIINRADVYEGIEKYIGENIVFEFISRYTGVGLSVILVFYLMILLAYIFIAFGIPNIMYIITRAFIRNETGSATNFVIWLLCFLSFIPGVWCTTNMITLFTTLANVNIKLYHILALFIIQAAMIVMYIVEAIRSKSYKEEINNG